MVFEGLSQIRSVAAAGDHEWNTNILSADRRIIMPAVNAMIPQVKEALLLLTKSVVVLVCRRVKDCGDAGAGVVLL